MKLSESFRQCFSDSGVRSALCVALLAVAAYLLCLRNQFVYDDYLIIVRNPHILTTEFLRAFPTSDYFILSGEASYRPFASLLYYAIAMACGINPFAFHLVSVLLHAAVTVLVLRLGRRAGMGGDAAWLAAAFAVHPLLSEAVCSINYSEDLLVTLFILVAVLSATHRSMSLWSRLAVASFATALACFSKESGVMALPLIVLGFVTWGPAPLSRRQAAAVLGGVGTVVAGFLVIRFGLLPGLVQDVHRVGSGPVDVVANASMIVMRYIGRMVFPDTLLADRIPVLSHQLGDWRIWAALAGHLGLLGIAAATWRKTRVIGFGILWFYLCIAPTSNLMAMSCPEADRYLYLSGIGLLVAGLAGVRLVAERWPAAARGLNLGCLSLLLLWAVRTELRIPQWYDNFTLWSHDAAANPANDGALAELAVELNARGRPDDAFRVASQALLLNPSNAIARLQCAKVSHASGQAGDALNLYEAAIRSGRLHPHLQGDAWLNYGMLLEDQLARTNDAEVAYTRALECTPSALASTRLGVIFAQQGRVDDAIRVWREALVRVPDDPLLKANLAFAVQQTNAAAPAR